MGNYNQTILMGNLTKEPELHYTQSGASVASFDIAVNTKYGEKEETLFMPCVVFGKLADIVVKYAPKGKNVLVTGRLVLESWTNAEEQKRSKIKLYVNSLQLLGGPTGAGNPKEKTESEDF